MVQQARERTADYRWRDQLSIASIARRGSNLAAAPFNDRQAPDGNYASTTRMEVVWLGETGEVDEVADLVNHREAHMRMVGLTSIDHWSVKFEPEPWPGSGQIGPYASETAGKDRRHGPTRNPQRGDQVVVQWGLTDRSARPMGRSTGSGIGRIVQISQPLRSRRPGPAPGWRRRCRCTRCRPGGRGGRGRTSGSRGRAAAAASGTRAQRVVDQQPAGQRLADAEDHLDRLGRLEHPDGARQHAQHPGLGAAGRQLRRRRRSGKRQR